MFFLTNFSLFFQSRFLLPSAFPYAVIIIVIITVSLILIAAIDGVVVVTIALMLLLLLPRLYDFWHAAYHSLSRPVARLSFAPLLFSPAMARLSEGPSHDIPFSSV